MLTPQTVSEETIDRFMQQNHEWMSRQIKRCPPLEQAYLQYKTCYYLGRSVTLVSQPSQLSDVIVLPEAACDKLETRKQALKTYFKQQAETVFPKRLQYWSEKTGLKAQHYRLKWLNSRWGSCSVNGAINLNIALMGAPLTVIDYVIVHELCHLKEMNHSARFWALLEQYYTAVKAAKSWLKNKQHYLMLLSKKEALC